MLLTAGVAAPAVLCALIGISHPQELTAETAGYWQAMHIALIPVFPLLGIAPWLVARRVDRRLGWLAGLFGYGFATFYTSLDILAGVAAGTLVLAGQPDSAAPVFAVARPLAAVGAWSLVLGTLVASAAAIFRARLRAIPGAALALLGASLVYSGHIYLGRGTLAMLLLAAGYTVLVFAVTRDRSDTSTGAPDRPAGPAVEIS